MIDREDKQFAMKKCYGISTTKALKKLRAEPVQAPAVGNYQPSQQMRDALARCEEFRRIPSLYRGDGVKRSVYSL